MSQTSVVVKGRQGMTTTTLALLTAAMLAVASLAVACADDQPAVPAGDPNITGVVATATPADGSDVVSAFLIDRGNGDYDKASVTVTGDTGWYRRSGDGFEAIDRPTATALTGKSVEVRFTGPVAESYPVQATAAWVVLGD